MGEFIGRQYEVGIGKEITQGTAVEPTAWIPRTDFTYDERRDYVMNEEGNGSLANASNAEIVKEYSDGEIGGRVREKSTGLIFLSTLGKVTSSLVSGETAVYKHEFEVDEQNTHPSLTIEFKNPIEQLAFAGSMITSLKLNAEIGGYFDYNGSFIGEKGATATHTPSLVTDDVFTSRMIKIYVADSLTNIENETPLCVESIETSIDKDVAELMCLADTTPSQRINKTMTVETNLKMRYKDLTEKALFTGGDEKAVRIVIENTSKTIGTGSNPSLRINMPKCVFTEWDRDASLDDVVTQDVKLTALYDTTTAKQISMTLVNEQASY